MDDKNFNQYFSELLTEEMGIIRNVQSDAQVISYKVINGIKNGQDIPVTLQFTSHKRGSFTTDITVSKDKADSEKKKRITVKWFYYSFADVQTQKEQMPKIPYGTKYNQDTDTLSVVVFAINGKVDNRTLIDSIAHELTHVFQRDNKGNDLLPTKDKHVFYQAVNRNMGNRIKAFRWIADILYLSHNFEQDAFLNGAYAYIMEQYKDGKDFMSSYKETEAYVSLHSLRHYLDIIHKNVDENNIGNTIHTHCETEYGLTIGQILSIGEKSYARYSRKLTRMIGQALNDIDKQERMHIPYHTMEFYEPSGLTEILNKFENNNSFLM